MQDVKILFRTTIGTEYAVRGTPSPEGYTRKLPAKAEWGPISFMATAFLHRLGRPDIVPVLSLGQTTWTLLSSCYDKSAS